MRKAGLRSPRRKLGSELRPKTAGSPKPRTTVRTSGSHTGPQPLGAPEPPQYTGIRGGACGNTASWTISPTVVTTTGSTSVTSANRRTTRSERSQFTDGLLHEGSDCIGRKAQRPSGASEREDLGVQGRQGPGGVGDHRAATTAHLDQPLLTQILVGVNHPAQTLSLIHISEPTRPY